MSEEAAAAFFESLGEAEVPTEAKLTETAWRASGVAVLPAAQFVVAALVADEADRKEEVQKITKAAKEWMAENSKPIQDKARLEELAGAIWKVLGETEVLPVDGLTAESRAEREHSQQMASMQQAPMTKWEHILWSGVENTVE